MFHRIRWLRKNENKFPRKVTQSLEDAHVSDGLEQRFFDNECLPKPFFSRYPSIKAIIEWDTSITTEDSLTSFPGILAFITTQQTFSCLSFVPYRLSVLF